MTEPVVKIGGLRWVRCCPSLLLWEKGDRLRWMRSWLAQHKAYGITRKLSSRPYLHLIHLLLRKIHLVSPAGSGTSGSLKNPLNSTSLVLGNPELSTGLSFNTLGFATLPTGEGNLSVTLGATCLVATRARSRENDTQSFSNTLAPFHYPE